MNRWSTGLVAWLAAIAAILPLGGLPAADFDVTASLRVEGNGKAYTAGIVVPTTWPEQTVELRETKVHNGTARIERVGAGGAMLVLRTDAVSAGDDSEVVQRYRVRVEPVFVSVTSDDFADALNPARRRLLAEYLKPSPGIECADATIRDLAKTLGGEASHPLDFARAAFRWVHEEIRYKEGEFTSAATAVRDRVGDCEEKASVFIALCRTHKIPARTVWAPGHCWAEFCLVDHAGQPHWIPAHTSGDPWFGMIKEPQVILQKGDNFRVREKKSSPTRLLGSWIRGPSPPPEWSHDLNIRRIDDGNDVVD